MILIHTLLRRLACMLAGVTLVSGIALAQMPDNIVFPDEPDDTIMLEDGRKIDVYRATVVSTRGNRLTVRYDHGGRYTYQVPPDFRFDIGGRKVPTRSLNRGDTLRAYVTRSDDTHHEFVDVDTTAAAPVVLAAAAPEPVADEDPAPMLPATASPLPLIGLLGAMSLGLGGLGFAIRRRIG